MSNSRNNALTIWQAGVNRVRSEALVRREIELRAGQLRIGTLSWEAEQIGSIQVVGAGKAGAGMAAGVEAALSDGSLAHRVDGWINVPANCVRQLPHIHLHAARPAAFNEPTPEGVVGAVEILRRVAALKAKDICIALISGGGSALLPAPRQGISLEDLLQVTRLLSAAGANIRELNGVRRQLSDIQGGGLARACRAGHLVTLIISDVLGDPLDLIASGPTVPIEQPWQAAAEALRLFDAFELAKHGVRPQVRDMLAADCERWRHPHADSAHISACISHTIIGNNDVATAAAAQTARQLGYETHVLPLDITSPHAESVGRELVRTMLDRLRTAPPDRPWCLISGGEPVVQLVETESRGRGGRNQQLVLAALCELLAREAELPGQWAILSGGTDGEDGPTDAAGAVIDAPLLAAARTIPAASDAYLRRNDAYSYFEPLDGLLRTGPTDTNVCDIRVMVLG